MTETEATVLRVRCPTCRARRGKRCSPVRRAANGRQVPFHRSRIVDATRLVRRRGEHLRPRLSTAAPVSIGPANDSYPNADIELELAGFLAGAAAHDPVDVRIIEDVGLYVDDDAVDLYQEGLIEHATELVEKRAAALRRPRSLIERMIDEACGIEAREDGTIVPLAR